jgi:hypothetical protein
MVAPINVISFTKLRGLGYIKPGETLYTGYLIGCNSVSELEASSIRHPVKVCIKSRAFGPVISLASIVKVGGDGENLVGVTRLYLTFDDLRPIMYFPLPPKLEAGDTVTLTPTSLC